MVNADALRRTVERHLYHEYGESHPADAQLLVVDSISDFHSTA
jgi:hypothetical protein